MGSCACKPKDHNSAYIDAKMKQNERFEQSSIKLLFLGPGGSGKSTIFKQLQYLHGNGFTERGLSDLKRQIDCQIISQMQDAIKYYLQEPNQDEKVQQAITALNDCDCTEQLSREIASDIQYIWQNDERLKSIFDKHQHNKILFESTEYFWNSMDRILEKNYEPTKADIMNIRNRTTGINEKRFTVKGQNFHIFDVGGQKSERKKWINCFDEVKAVIFVVSLSCYNETMFEDVTTNCMTDALELFADTINNECFADTPIILFLNKTDLFADKIRALPITICPAFEDFEANNNAEAVYINNNPNDYIQTASFVKYKFEQVSTNKKREIYSHLTCAMDDKNIDDVFSDVVCIILRQLAQNCKMLSLT